MKIAFKYKAKNGILQEFIDKNGWTQRDFARALNVSPSILGRWMNLQEYPRNEETIKKIITMVGRTEEEIFPNSIRSKEFLSIEKSGTLYKEVDIEYLPFNQLAQISYEEDFDKKQDIHKELDKILDTLTKREKQVITMRYLQEMSLTDTSVDLGITRERINQLERKALVKLKHPSRLQKLREWSTLVHGR